MEIQACNTQACSGGGTYFTAGPWSACSAPCAARGAGGAFVWPSQARTVTCWDPSAGGGAGAVVSDGSCGGTKPQTRRACNAQPCPGDGSPAPSVYGGGNCTGGLLDRTGACCSAGSMVRTGKGLGRGDTRYWREAVTPSRVCPRSAAHLQSAAGVCCLPYAGTASGGVALSPPAGVPGASLLPVDECGVCGGVGACALQLRLRFASEAVGAALCAPGARGLVGIGFTSPPAGAAAAVVVALTAGLRSVLALPTATASPVPVVVTSLTCLSLTAEAAPPAGRYRVEAAVTVGPATPSATGGGLSTAAVLAALNATALPLAGEAGNALPPGSVAVLPGASPGQWTGDGATKPPSLAVNGTSAAGTLPPLTAYAVLGAGARYRSGACGNGVCEAGEACLDALCANTGACPGDCGGGPVRPCPIPPAGYGVPPEQAGVPCGGPGRGACRVANGTCACAPGYGGAGCQLAALPAGGGRR